ncbi:unnamed protein product [Hymenolepis diminuta]|uniref:Uncharacterized protein n=1 Tax=Hymenolepis diminuta TaxID=6216 RepID=A0A564XWC1_HYMDI|nr:unnamed protein product [Hymenolepis diminuta]
MTDHLSTEGTHSPSDNHLTNIRNSHSKDTDFAENVAIIETAFSKTLPPELQRKLPQRRLLLGINEVESKQQESFNLDEAEK